jgi:hypothetical protein
VAARIVESVPDMDAKFYAATRHVLPDQHRPVQAVRGRAERLEREHAAEFAGRKAEVDAAIGAAEG